MKNPQEYKAAFCPACRKYEARWREAHGKRFTYQGMKSMNNVLQEMFKKSEKISEAAKEYVVLSGMCKGCGMPSIYDTERIDELIFFNRDIKGFLFDRSEDDVQKILLAFGQSLEETGNNPFEACLLMLDKLEEYRIDF